MAPRLQRQSPPYRARRLDAGTILPQPINTNAVLIRGITHAHTSIALRTRLLVLTAGIVSVNSRLSRLPEAHATSGNSCETARDDRGRVWQRAHDLPRASLARLARRGRARRGAAVRRAHAARRVA